VRLRDRGGPAALRTPDYPAAFMSSVAAGLLGLGVVTLPLQSVPVLVPVFGGASVVAAAVAAAGVALSFRPWAVGALMLAASITAGVIDILLVARVTSSAAPVPVSALAGGCALLALTSVFVLTRARQQPTASGAERERSRGGAILGEGSAVVAADRCRRCGAPAGGQARFCGVCGVPLSEPLGRAGSSSRQLRKLMSLTVALALVLALVAIVQIVFLPYWNQLSDAETVWCDGHLRELLQAYDRLGLNWDDFNHDDYIRACRAAFQAR
jgi:hypothetical protein